MREPMLPTRERLSVWFATACMCAGTLGWSAPAESQGGESVSNGATARATGDTEQFSDTAYLDLVSRYALDGGATVDYARWQGSPEDMAALDRHIAVIARISPRSHAALFDSAEKRRRYWINTYNALVLDAVLDYWPLESVRDVKLSLGSRMVRGKGFFYDREVTVGGETMNLLDVETEALSAMQDPRVHFALNCASDSCPALRASDWSDSELDAAARDFVNDPANVRVEDGKVFLSRIFKWYRDEFPENLYAYLQQYAEPELRTELEAGIEGDFPTRSLKYDWSLNAEQ